jgi:hypothetical protein
MDGSWGLPRSLYPIVATYFVSDFKSKNIVLGLEFSVSSAHPSCAMWFLYVENFSLYFELNLIACVICTIGVCVVCCVCVCVYVGGGTARIGLDFYINFAYCSCFGMIWYWLHGPYICTKEKKTFKEINQRRCWRSLTWFAGSNSIPFIRVHVRVYTGRCVLCPVLVTADFPSDKL